MTFQSMTLQEFVAMRLAELDKERADILARFPELRSERRSMASAGAAVPSSSDDRPRRTMSAAARAKIGAAQRARWAKQKRHTR